MTTELPDSHSPEHAEVPLALKSNEGLGPTPRIDVRQVVYALERQEKALLAHAEAMGVDYNAEFPAEDAERMKEATAICREREVLARWIAEACGVLFSVEEEAEDGGESLRMLRERGLRLVRAVLPPVGPNVRANREPTHDDA